VNEKRHTTRRNRFRRIISRDQPPCHICGGEILSDIGDHIHPLSYQADHIVPVPKGGSDTLSNIAASHRRCNQSRYSKSLPGQQMPGKPKPVGVTFITHGDWWSKLAKTRS
jgi:5-methylcytosine-specific restriction endonuclease McrA